MTGISIPGYRAESVRRVLARFFSTGDQRQPPCGHHPAVTLASPGDARQRRSAGCGPAHTRPGRHALVVGRRGNSGTGRCWSTGPLRVLASPWSKIPSSTNGAINRRSPGCEAPCSTPTTRSHRERLHISPEHLLRGARGEHRSGPVPRCCPRGQHRRPQKSISAAGRANPRWPPPRPWTSTAGPHGEAREGDLDGHRAGRVEQTIEILAQRTETTRCSSVRPGREDRDRGGIAERIIEGRSPRC